MCSVPGILKKALCTSLVGIVARFYIDEAGTHGGRWLVIGLLVVPDHPTLHNALVRVKTEAAYFDTAPKPRSKFRELHLAKFHRASDLDMAKQWVEVFLAHNCYFRCIVIDWDIWDGRHFGSPFEHDSLKKRRAYKKWLEMLLLPEAKKHKGADLFLDKLIICHGYEILKELEMTHARGEYGSVWLNSYKHADSAKDANQALQLCDLLTGCVYQSLVPAVKNAYKTGARDHLYKKLESVGVKSSNPSYWRGFHRSSLVSLFPKFSEWFWAPSGNTRNAKGSSGRRK